MIQSPFISLETTPLTQEPVYYSRIQWQIPPNLVFGKWVEKDVHGFLGLSYLSVYLLSEITSTELGVA